MPSAIIAVITPSASIVANISEIVNISTLITGSGSFLSGPTQPMITSITGRATLIAAQAAPLPPPPLLHPYSYATFGDALGALGSRLYDPGAQQWTATEMIGYIVESLRTWNALSGFWRSEMVFPLALNVWWYDLKTLSSSNIPYTVTQWDIIKQIENHLLEPPTPDSWSGSSQFNLYDISIALQRRQDDTLGTTGCIYTRSTPSADITTRTVLPDTAIDIRRVAWIPSAGFGYSNKVLKQSDMYAARAFNPYYTTVAEGPPSTWLQNTEPPLSFDVDQIPPVPGTYDVLTINSGSPWVIGTNALLSIPDDWSWVIKWGALSDLLSRESNAKDTLRAEYSRKRYVEGLALLESMPTVLALRLNNIPMAVDPLKSGDDYNPRWQAAASGAPRSAYAAGNLLAFTAPDSGTAYSATVSTVSNAPIGGSFIQVARDDFDAIIDYAQHLAMFKSGGAEFAATIPLYQNFQRKAAQYNSKLKEMGFFSMEQLDLSQNEEQQRPRYLVGAGPAD